MTSARLFSGSEIFHKIYTKFSVKNPKKLLTIRPPFGILIERLPGVGVLCDEAGDCGECR
jgi:hypothetical protein